jgi:hypothetical protein
MKRVGKKCGHERTKANTCDVSVSRPHGRCRLCKRTAHARYNRSKNGRARDARYRQTEKRRLSRARYESSAQGRAATARYNSSEEKRAARARYRNSEKGVLAERRNKDVQRANGNAAASSRRYRANRGAFLNSLVEGEAAWIKSTFGRKA